jgi:uncharacterized C2H2 Zn-finger protein
MINSQGIAKEMGKKMPTRFQAVSVVKAEILQDGDAKMYCPRCGMTLPMFYKTNHAAHVNDKTKQYCSIHCLAESMAEGLKLTDIKVVDVSTLKFIDVKKANYVYGSSKSATMSMTSKYAFAKKADADAFAKEFGGEVMNFSDTMSEVEFTLSNETAMIHKKQAMAAKKGEMLYKKMCTPITKKFTTTSEAKAYLTNKKSCGVIKGKMLQVIGLYLKSRKD